MDTAFFLFVRACGSAARAARLPLMLALVLAATPGQRAYAQEESAPEKEPPLAEIDRYVEQAMEDWGVPGLALAVVKDGAVVRARGYGVREVGKPAPVTEETLFLLASTTKAFTAAALGLLVDEGQLGWDDPVTRYLPAFELQDPYVTRALTIRDLLTHQVGIERADRLWWASPLSREEVLRRARHLEPVAGFRSRFGYNNVMYMAATEVVEAVSGEPWDRFVERRLFEPLGMRASTASVRALPRGGDVATPHARIEGEVRPIAWRNFDSLGGAGALNSNAAEMAEWLKLQLGQGTYEGQRLLSVETVEEMHAAQKVIPLTDAYAKLHPQTHFRAYGLGWFLQDYRGRKLVQHPGSLDGMRARVGMIPEEGLGVVLLSNMTESGLTEALMLRIFDAYLGAEPPRDWSAVLLAAREEERAEAEARKDSVRAARVEGTRPSLPLARYAGAYADSAYGEATVALEAGRLVLRRGPAYTGDLEHWHYDTFRVTWRDPYMGETFATFTLNAAGEVDAVAVQDLTEFERAPDRADEPASSDAEQ